MNRIDREKMVVRQMIEIYCRRIHCVQGLCPECERLLDYALNRLSHCPKGNSKSSCRKCEVHCYAPVHKEEIRKVMKSVGPKMIFIHPLSAIRHLITELK